MSLNNLDAIKKDLVIAIIFLMALASLPITVMMAIRSKLEYGSFPILIYLFPALLWSLVGFRNQLSVKFQTLTFSIGCLLCFISGILERGIYGPAFFFFIMAILLPAFVMSTRQLSALITVYVFVAIALLSSYLLGFYDLKVTGAMTDKLPFSWVTYATMPLFVMLLMVYVIHSYNSEVLSLSKQLTKANEKLNTLAHYDGLTKLLNYRTGYHKIEQVLAHCKRYKEQCAILFLDLDGFKGINDNHGHDAGDQVLVQVAERLQQVTRDEDILVRVGGDEFIIAMSSMKNKKDIEIFAAKIIAAIQQPFGVNSTQMSIGVSIGISIFPDSGNDLDSLKRAADSAMYQVKKAGKNNYQFIGSRAA